MNYKSSRAVHNQRLHLDNKGDNPWTTSLVGLYTINGGACYWGCLTRIDIFLSFAIILSVILSFYHLNEILFKPYNLHPWFDSATGSHVVFTHVDSQMARFWKALAAFANISKI